MARQPADSSLDSPRRRVQFLLAVDTILRATPDIAESFPRLAGYLLPLLGDWCLIDIAEEGRLHRIAGRHADPGKQALITQLGEYGSDSMPARVLMTGRAFCLNVIGDPRNWLPSTDARMLERAASALGVGAVAMVPVQYDSQPTGVLTCVRSPARGYFTPIQLALLRTIGRRAGDALAYSNLYRRSLAAIQAKDEFLAMLGHELRNPIAAIIHAVQVMERMGTPEEPVARLRSIIDRQARHLSRLVEELLDVSRLTSGKIVLRKERVDLKDIADRCLGLQLENPRQAHAVELNAESVVVSGDPTRLQQIVGNVLENSVKYTPAGGRIQVAVRRDGDWGVVVVEDTGSGIPPDVLPRIFDLFAQGPQAAPSAGGLGIGLTLVRRLVELHGGTVMVESAGPGRGTRMQIALPIAVDGDGGPPRPVASDRASTRHVLVVEDNPDAQEALVALLTAEGHRVSAAATGSEGVELAGRSRPDAAFVDIGLPGMDGYEVARRLRALPGPRIRLVALTGYGQAADRQRTQEAGFDVHLVKPVDLDELNRVLAALDGSAEPTSA